MKEPAPNRQPIPGPAAPGLPFLDIDQVASATECTGILPFQLEEEEQKEDPDQTEETQDRLQ